MNPNQSIDSSNMHKSIYDFPGQMSEAISIGKKIKLINDHSFISNIVICGMGGSAIGGDLAKSLINDSLKVPIFVSRNYSVPNWVNDKSLVICSSYSGNTEETLSAFSDAKSKGARIIGISTGGELSKLLDESNYDSVSIPPGLQPRAAVAFSFIPLLYLLNILNMLDKKVLDEINSAIEKIKSYRKIYCEKTEDNPACKLAKQIYRTIPILYGESGSTSTIALRWKGQFCENSKMLAYHNEIPEMNHNEIVGWQENPELLKHFSIIWISDDSLNPRNAMRYDSSMELINKMVSHQEVIKFDGETYTERFLHLLHFGDWLSYWCALMHQADPTPVEKIDKLKKALSEKS